MFPAETKHCNMFLLQWKIVQHTNLFFLELTIGLNLFIYFFFLRIHCENFPKTTVKALSSNLLIFKCTRKPINSTFFCLLIRFILFCFLESFPLEFSSPAPIENFFFFLLSSLFPFMIYFTVLAHHGKYSESKNFF